VSIGRGVALAERSAKERSRAFWRLLIGILLVYGLIVIAGDLKFSAPVRVALLGVVVVLDLRTRRRRRAQLGAAVLAGAAVTATVLAATAGSLRVLAAVQGLATAALVAVAIASIVRTLRSWPGVDLATVIGVLDVYLLLALLFASVHQLFSAFQTGYLRGVQGLPSSSDDLYFSVITLTTVGFGDITPGTELARTVTITEALLGQLYLVSIVAGVVSGWRRQPPSGRAEPDGSDALS
jgi:hypothetical protein